MGRGVQRLKAHLAEISDLVSVERVLGWDQQTYMPPGGGAQRAQQVSTLNRIVHTRMTSAKTGRLLDAAAAEVDSLPEEHEDRCLVRITRRDYQRSKNLPTAFVAAWTGDAILSNEVWRHARKANDFAAFRPSLEKMVGYARRAADYHGYEAHPYDALLEDYEPGLTTAEVERIFSVLRKEQVELVRAIARRPEPRADFLYREYPEAKQGEFGLRVAADFGYDLRRGRLDTAPHPFETSLGRDDVRITTRYDRNDLKQSIFAIWHEAGHGLYEQNISPSLARTPLSHGCSNVFHESQSRLWENIVARSRAFWEYYFPTLQQKFLESLSNVGVDDFYRAVNRVRPSLIRVEADEVTYNLHIMLRFDLEKGLIEGSLGVAELPELWRAKMEEYLGIAPPDDRDGVMQDTHWSGGSFGYFPTYALGNVMAAQIYDTARRDRPEIASDIGVGQFSTLREWLVDRVYRHGRMFPPHELAVRVNGRPLDPQPYLEYLRSKFGALYGLTS